MKEKIKENVKRQILNATKLASSPVTWFGIYEPRKPDCLKEKNESTYKKITSYFYSHESNYDEVAVFQYGLEAILSSIYCLGIAFLLCAILGESLFGILYLVFLSAIKMQFTSYHAKTRLMCCIIYNLITLVNVYLYKQNINVSMYIPLVLLLFIALLRKNELCIFNFSLLVLYAIILCISYVYNYSLYSLVMQVLFTEVFLILLKNCQIKPKSVE